jgi:Tfp pilus assembly protein PilV
MPPSETNIRRPSNSGFSLIEVMVATTVLMIIVLMVAMVFQQSSGAWSGGTRRANAQMTLRSVLGQMQRELTEAVDAREFSSNMLSIANTAAYIDATSADFVALIGDPADPVGDRVPYHIRYSFDGSFVQRTCTKINFDRASGVWRDGAIAGDGILNASQALSFFKLTRVSAADPHALPLRVDIEARVDNNDKALIVSGWSAGRDGVDNTDDDIVAGAKVTP